ncbi:hypothetical protein F3C99_07615 [Vitellibacter sp. q18]|jgi:hypothetical protein|uniref:Outer membrane protein beta-barrel domain-containing protein n=2 Tax=Flavobacteriales TaxID=200644 RepID=A0ABR5DKU7_9FLAO|nr:hypothetical protein MB09_03970 [Aequorivita vladivostokensis]MRT16822.1 hypothetical protein [Aequorivita lutea]|tara:strand:+ start:208 stop:852 length:645 start_codon:yes stop_codon:yes gene_type:complete
MRKKGFILLFILFNITMNGQTEMLIGQISGRFVIRENFDEKGAFLNKQTFEAGKTMEKNGYFEIDVITELFDKDKKSTDKYTTTYRCKPDEASVMVMAFPFSNPKSEETEINTISANFKELYDLENLEDIELEMSFDSGLLNFFGSKSTIKIYDRKLDSNKKKINSKINIKAYALGIRIKQLNYNVYEKLNGNGLLTFQKFTEEDNSYFTMTYN